MFYPNFTKDGDTIGICAPSAGVGHKIESFEKSLTCLKNNGYKIVETPSVMVDNIRPSSGEQRAKEFHSLLESPQVNAIIAASGGEYCIEMLPYLNSDLIKKNPKWFCGYSDPTNIEFYLTTKLDIATIYGFNAGGFDWDELHEFQLNQLQILKGSLITQHSFDYYDSDRSYNKIDFKLDTPVKWDLYLPGMDSPSVELFEASGRLIGGCTDVISNLVGTPYDGAKEFIDKYSSDGFIWYFDTFEMSPLQLYLTLLQFKYAGYFNGANLIIFGRIMFPGENTDEEYVEFVRDALPDIPFIWGADVGHTKPSLTLINGSIAKLKYKNNKATIDMKLK